MPPWRVVDLEPRIGSAIYTDRETLVSGARATDIRELLELRGVIAFPEIHMSDEEQIAFTHTLGTLAHEEGEDGEDCVYPITMDESINPVASYLKGAFFWHIDGTMSDRPILASIMSSRRLSPRGGETEFCNTYAAWDELPDPEEEAARGPEGGARHVADPAVPHAGAQLRGAPELAGARTQRPAAGLEASLGAQTAG